MTGVQTCALPILIGDPNDQAEANEFVAELFALAIKFACPIIGAIHLNPGSGEKTRGHLGSQLERKAETNLRLEKDEDQVMSLWSDKARREPILKSQAVCFGWDQARGYHVTLENAKIRRAEKLAAAKREELGPAVDDAFRGRGAMPYGELKKAIMESSRCQERGAEKRISAWNRYRLIQKTVAGLYEQAT